MNQPLAQRAITEATQNEETDRERFYREQDKMFAKIERLQALAKQAKAKGNHELWSRLTGQWARLFNRHKRKWQDTEMWNDDRAKPYRVRFRRGRRPPKGRKFF